MKNYNHEILPPESLNPDNYFKELIWVNNTFYSGSDIVSCTGWMTWPERYEHYGRQLEYALLQSKVKKSLDRLKARGVLK